MRGVVLRGDVDQLRVGAAPGVVEHVGAGLADRPADRRPPGVDADHHVGVGGAHPRRRSRPMRRFSSSASISTPGAALMPPMSTISAPCSTTSRDPVEGLVLGPGGALVVEGVRGPVDDRHHQASVVGERVPAETERHARSCHPAEPRSPAGVEPVTRGGRSRLARPGRRTRCWSSATWSGAEPVERGGRPRGSGSAIAAEVAQRLVPVRAAAEVDLGDRVEPEQPERCRSARPARRRTRSGTEQPLEQRRGGPPTRRPAAAPASSARASRSAISGRATSSVTRPPSNGTAGRRRRRSGRS